MVYRMGVGWGAVSENWAEDLGRGATRQGRGTTRMSSLK